MNLGKSSLRTLGRPRISSLSWTLNTCSTARSFITSLTFAPTCALRLLRGRLVPGGNLLPPALLSIMLCVLRHVPRTAGAPTLTTPRRHVEASPASLTFARPLLH